MTHARSEALASAGFDDQTGGLVAKLRTLRTEIDAALIELARDPGVRLAAIGLPARALPPHSAETPISPIEEDLIDPLHELGVIGCILGLRRSS